MKGHLKGNCGFAGPSTTGRGGITTGGPRTNGFPAAGGFKVTPLRRIKATAFDPAAPSWSPSMNRPKLSCKPKGAIPRIVSSTALVSANAFLGVRVTVSFAGLNRAERSLSTREFVAVNDLFPFAVANR